MPTPLLILSDAPTAGTGLSRICRDLAVRIHEHLPEFRVATLGGGGQYSRHLGFPQYEWNQNGEFVVHELPDVWGDFAGYEKGVVMTIWDASRLLWFSRPETCAYPRLKQFLENRPYQTWGYFPIDATGPNDKLTGILAHTIAGYERVLCYSHWAADILERTWGQGKWVGEHLPHGIDTSVFQPRHRATARHGFGERIGIKNQKGKFINIPDDATMIGIVATNQIRKDWGLGIATVAELAKERNVLLWCHTDTLERHWSLPALLQDFGLAERAIVTCLPLTDEQMSYCYSACDVTLGIGLGEGFGYPIFESLACGTPVVHGGYGGAHEHLKAWVFPPAWRIEGPYNCYRPVFEVDTWKRAAIQVIEEGRCSLPPALDWNNLWPHWAEWLRKGIA